jgi:hypothetical protein
MAYESELEAELEDEFEAELEDETEDEMEDEAGLEGEGWLGTLGNIAGSLLGESEDEYEAEDEYEGEDEDEYELSPIRKVYPDAVMEHLGELASEAESEDEAAEHFLPLIGMAASKLLPVVAKAIMPTAKRALPKMARAVTKATPHLTKGIVKVAKALHRNPQTRHLLKTVPAIARRTVGKIAHHAARGGHVTPHAAVRHLAKQTRHVLGTPAHRAHALRHHNHLERRFHGRLGRGVGYGVGHAAHPHWRYGWRGGRHYRGHAGVGRVAPRYVGRRGVGGVARPGVGVHGHAVGAPGVGIRAGRRGRAVGGGCGCSSCGCCQCCGR